MEEKELKHTLKTTDPKEGVEFIVHADESDLAGQVLNERYKIISEIGSGGMGKVYKAEHVLLHKIQAVKVLHRHLSGEAQSLQRFQIEAKAASSLRHDNLLTVSDYGVTEAKAPYIVMDYVEGESLSDYLEKHKKLSVPDFIKVFSQVLNGLVHAHGKGVIHRDLKPSNIMLSLDQEGGIDSVRIVDFGIAKILPNDQGAAQHLTQTGEIFGSPLYMSPEQCRGGKIDFRADIYSLGCVMFEALTGQVPVKGENAVETLYKHMSESAPSISQTFPELKIPSSIDNIVAKCLANDHEQRYANASQLAEALAQVNANDPSLPFKSASKKENQSGTKPVYWLPTPVLCIGLACLLATLSFVAYKAFSDQNQQAIIIHEKQAGQTAVATEDSAADHLDKAWKLYTKNSLDQSKSEAEQAWNLAKQVSTKSPVYAQSCNMLGLIDARKLEESKQEQPLLAHETEGFLQEAVDDAPARGLDKMSEPGQPRYRRDLANFYLYEKKWNLAEAELNKVLEGAGRTIDDLKSDGVDADVLRQFIHLYWGQGEDLKAARLTIALSMPDAMPNLTNSSDFGGHWVYSQTNKQVAGSKLQDYEFVLDVKNEGHNQLAVKAHGVDGQGRVGGDFQTAGTVKGSVADLSWRGDGTEYKAKLYRLGDYMLWRVTEPSDQAQGWPEEVLSRAPVDAGTTERKAGAPKADSAAPGTSDGATSGATVNGGVEKPTQEQPKLDESMEDQQAKPILLPPKTDN